MSEKQTSSDPIIESILNRDVGNNFKLSDFEKEISKYMVTEDIWELFGLFRQFSALNPASENTFSGCDAQIKKYIPLYDKVHELDHLINEIQDDVPKAYDAHSREIRLSERILISHLLDRLASLQATVKQTLQKLDEIDHRHPKTLNSSNVNGLPKEIWFNIFQCLSPEEFPLVSTFIRATNYGLNSLIREYTRYGNIRLEDEDQVTELAARFGYRSYLKFYFEHGVELGPECCVMAAKYGHMETLEDLHLTYQVPIEIKAIKAAAIMGQFKCFEFTSQHGSVDKNDWKAIGECAIRGGNIDCMSFCIGKGSQLELIEDDIFNNGNAYNSIMYLLLTIDISNIAWSPTWVNEACAHGEFECLKYFYENNFVMDEDCIAHAKTFECFKYLYDRGYRSDECLVRAATNGSLEIIKFLHEAGQPWTPEVLVQALADNHLDCFEYALNNGCPITEAALVTAAAAENFSALQALHQRGAEVTGAVLAMAVMQGHKEMSLWAASKCTALPDGLCTLAAGADLLEILTLAHCAGCPWGPETLVAAVGSGSVDCFKYALDNGCECTPEVVERIAMRHNLPLFEYVHQKGVVIPKDIRSTIWECLENDNDVLTPYLNAHNIP